MKILTNLVLFTVLFVVGCQENNSILEPTNNPVENFSKYEEIVNLTSFKEKFTKNYTVNGEKGGILFLKISWFNADSVKIKMESKLTIPKGAFKGDLTFDMIFDLENYALELYPSPYTFDIPVLLDLKFANIDLSNIDPVTSQFSYLDGIEQMEYKRINIDGSKGSLAVYGAELHHFSRYGWTRKK